MTPEYCNKSNDLYLSFKFPKFLETIFKYIFNYKEIWDSRSVATVGVIFAYNDDKIFVLAEKRSDTMPDAPGKWVAPGGYLDKNESGWDSMRRELYEETSLNTNDYSEDILFDNNKEPFFVKSNPDENRQNIVLNYCVIIDFSEKTLPDIENFKNSEVAELKWVQANEVFLYDWAFEHGKRINMALNFYTKQSKTYENNN